MMFISVTMSARGLYEYDTTLFDLLRVPAGVDRETVVQSILLESASREILYPDHSVLKRAIGLWSERNQETWKRLYNTTTIEYDPISNYDRNEEWEDTAHQSAQGNSNNTSNTDGTDTERIKAFNDETLSDAAQNVTKNVNIDTNVSSNTIDGSNKRKGRAWGNIGVTTTQQMLQAERETVQFNIYDYIATDFCNKFCLGVW